MLGTLNTRQIDHVLRSEVVGHLGCCADGIKLPMLRAHPQVCLQVERIENLANWVSVIVWGV
jgi:nitroimidazol reductase NimA-like FMN-containing flavoprotein (pyridoxamine 5'-phosphate oxidase superfamily)